MEHLRKICRNAFYAALTKTSEGATNTTYSFRGGSHDPHHCRRRVRFAHCHRACLCSKSYYRRCKSKLWEWLYSKREFWSIDPRGRFRSISNIIIKFVAACCLRRVYRRSEPCVLRNRRTAIPIPRRPCISPSLSLVRTHHFFGFQRNYVANAPHATVPTTRLPPSRLIIGEISRHRHKGASAT